jgi:hypothetical protein
MATQVCDGLPLYAQQKELRKKRSECRQTDGVFTANSEPEKAARKALKGTLSYADANLVALWFQTLGMVWFKGGKQSEKETLQSAIYADLSARGYEVDTTNWVAYQVRQNLSKSTKVGRPFVYIFARCFNATLRDNS